MAIKIVKKSRFFVVLFVVLILVMVLVLNFVLDFKSEAKEPVKVSQKNNNSIEFNQEDYRLPQKINPQGLNLVFFADQYPSWSEFEEDISSLMQEIKKIEPWKSYSLFNLYKINPKKSGLCYIKVKNERKSVLRCQEEINNYLNNLPLERFKLIVLSKQKFQSWANMVRLKNSGIFFSIPSSLDDDTTKKTHGLLFAHLLGHAFGLKDEETFVLAKAGGAPHTPDGPNCAPDASTAEKWWGDLAKQFPKVGYFQSCCSNKNYIKPTQSSIMNLNTDSSIVYTYGPVSEDYLKKVLDYCFSPGHYNKANNDKEFFNRYSEFKECLK